MKDLTKFLTEAREVGANATVAPWDNYLETGLSPMVVTYTENEKGFRTLKESVACAGTVDAFANTEFIAFARNHWNEMLDLLERQHNQLALHKAPWCDNESDDELHKKLERQEKALEVFRKQIRVLQAMAGHPSAQDACRNIIAQGSYCLELVEAILAGKGDKE